ncbi:MAG: hypothetical protein JOY71_18750 [Acetobacteraceae bacterium]|nr:hypothetical protein [Acetobacteraceae bacterium]
MSEVVLTPIELTDAELQAVSGGAFVGGIRQSNRSRQSIRQSITETGGSIHVGGSGPTAVAGSITLTETFTASQTATNSSTQSNTNSGTVSGNAAAG